jgi:phytoene dehydrogenase-like protein
MPPCLHSQARFARRGARNHTGRTWRRFAFLVHRLRECAIVIGSGIGGLASAALLAKHGGQRVLVLERHYVAGGYTHTFQRHGYEWDVGVHYIGEVQPGTLLRALFDELTEAQLEDVVSRDVAAALIAGALTAFATLMRDLVAEIAAAHRPVSGKNQ